MVKLIIPEKVRIVSNKREVNVDEGDLIMLITKKGVSKSGDINSATLCVFDKIEKRKIMYRMYDQNGKERTDIKVKQPYHLHRCQSLGGVDIPLVLSSFKRSYTLESGLLNEICIGQEEIARRLREMPGFEPYVEWVLRLEKPYIR